jgi:hypothetical protein
MRTISTYRKSERLLYCVRWGILQQQCELCDQARGERGNPIARPHSARIFIGTAAYRRLLEDYRLLCSVSATLPTIARVLVHNFVLAQSHVGTTWREQLPLQCFLDERGSTTLTDYHPLSSGSFPIEASQSGSQHLRRRTPQTHSSEQMLFGCWVGKK